MIKIKEENNLNFWAKLPRPFFCLAPMSDVTDIAFRKILAKYGKPDVMYTEFVSVDGLCSEAGRPKLMIDLEYTKKERPIVAQIFGSKPDNFLKIAKLIKKLGFDGIDINMGCPERSINRKQCSGAELIRHPKLAAEIIAATKEGADGLPVSVKTRIGYNRNQIEEWIPVILDSKPAALIIHGRTKKEMSKMPADWQVIRQVVEMAQGNNIPVVGNGDVRSLVEAVERVEESGVDGVMVGRGIFGNPWLFNGQTGQEVSLDKRLRVMIEHAKLFEKLLMPEKRFDPIKKHFKAYLSCWPETKDLRTELMNVNSVSETEKVVKKYFNK